MDGQRFTLATYLSAAVCHGVSILISFIHGSGPIVVCTLISVSMYLLPPTAAMSVNVTVDDTFGNPDLSVMPIYLPAWHTGSPGEQCTICTIKPSELDMDQILDQSWHHGTYFLGIPIEVHVTFPGTAVYVYNVVPNLLPNGAITLVNMSFALDGETVGHFHAPDSSSEVLYHQLVYANASLADTVHTLVMSASGSEPSLIVFDYLVYTTEVEGTASATTAATSDTSSPTTTRLSVSSSARPPRVTILGGVVGGLALLLLVAALLLVLALCHRRRQTCPLASRSDYISTDDAIVTSIATTESYPRPLRIGLLSNAATVAGPSLGSATFGVASPSGCSSRSFEPKREAELMRRIEALQREMDGSRRRERGQERRSESESTSLEGRRLSMGAVQELRGEIATLTGVLSAMMTTVPHGRPAISEVLPGYCEAARRGAVRPGAGDAEVGEREIGRSRNPQKVGRSDVRDFHVGRWSRGDEEGMWRWMQLISFWSSSLRGA